MLPLIESPERRALGLVAFNGVQPLVNRLRTRRTGLKEQTS